MNKDTFISTLEDTTESFTFDTTDFISHSNGSKRLQILRQTLMFAYYTILIEYINTEYSEDNNFFDKEITKEIIEKFNNITGSNLYADFL